MSHLSVIVTDGSPIVLRVQAVLADWALVGLVGESVWVSPGDVTPTVGPPQVLSTVIGPDGTQRVDLFHSIGIRHLDTVRVVVAQLIVTGEDQVREIPELGRTLADLLTSVLPPPNTGESGKGTHLRLTNVLIPVSGVSGVSRDALLPGWDANAVVAAEDRTGLDTGSIFVRAGGNYDGHVAAAIASAAALWSGIDEGCLDVLDTSSTTTDTEVAVVRNAVRAIVRSDDVEELADAACASIISDPAAPARNAEWGRPAVHPGPVVDSLVAEIMTTDPWAARTPVPVPKPEKAKRLHRAALREAAEFNLQLFGLGLKAIVGMGTRAVENVATAAIPGAEGDYAVSFRPSSSGAVVLRAQARLDSHSEMLRNSKLIDQADKVATPDAKTWDKLRRSCFGLVDGSALPVLYAVPAVAGKAQLLPPSSVVPDPIDTFKTMNGALIRACDARAATEYLSALTEAAGPPPGAGPGHPHTEGPVPKPTKDSVAPVEATVGGAGGECLAAQAGRVNAQIESEPSEGEHQPPAEPRRAKDELEALEAWIGAREHSLMWRLHDGAAAQAARNFAEAQRAYEDATIEVPLPADALKKSRRRLIVAWSILGVVFAAASVYLWHWKYQLEQMTASELVKAVVGLVLVSLLVGVVFNHLFYQAESRFWRSFKETLASREETAERYVLVQSEALRLQLLVSRLNDWADIIGSVLHRPWTPQPVVPTATLSEEGLNRLPAAVAIALPLQQKSEISPVVMARVIQDLTPKGWATQLFQDAIEAYESHVRSAHAGGHLAADLDTLDGPTSPLALLCAFFVKGEAGTYATADARMRIEKALTDGALELPPRSVRRTGEYADGETVSDAQFFGGLLDPAISFVRDIWTPTGLNGDRNVPDEDKSTVWMPRGATAKRAGSVRVRPATGDVAMRVDIRHRCDISDLLLFSPEAAVKEPSLGSKPSGPF